MPRQATYRLLWSPQGHRYEVQISDGQESLHIEPESPAWFAWLDDISSFSFCSKQDHSCTVRKERVQRGDTYWYGYRRQQKKTTKRYLGRSADITVNRLEEVAALLDITGAIAAREEPAAMNVPHDPLLATKLHIPRPRPQLVHRPHLVERLQRGMEYALTLVSAPAGFGKTTLLAQWLSESNTPVAWLSLESDDNDPTRFFAYVIAALQTVDAHLGTSALALLRTPGFSHLEMALTLLTNDLMSRAAGDFALVLDDYHVIDASPIQRGMTFLLEHMPPRMHLFLSTRADPPLPLARLRAQGHLTEVRATELRFDVAETGTFLHKVMGLTLSPGEIASLESRTEGWIAGLQLAGLSLQSHHDPSAFLAAFTGSHRFILDYLSEEVLSRQSEPVQWFLISTSILDRLNGPLCDAVTEQARSREMLETLERTNLFVVSLDEERYWYRYHPLFADMLKTRLQQTQPQLIFELHRRASVWYEQHGYIVEAILYALAIADFERVARLLEEGAMSLAREAGNLRVQAQTALDWYNALPEVFLRTRPYLRAMQALLFLYSSQFKEALMCLEQVERSLQGDISAEQRHSVMGYSLAIRANFALYGGDLALSTTLASEALDLFPEREAVLGQAIVQVIAAHAFLVSGDVSPAVERLLADRMVALRTTSNLYQMVKSVTLLARMHTLQGRLREAAATYRQAAQAVPEPEMLRVLMYCSLDYYFGLGDVLREWNTLDAASRLLLQGLELEQGGGNLTVSADTLLLGYTALARLYLARGDVRQALATLETFIGMAHQRHFVPQVFASVKALQAQMELAQGNLQEAIRWANEIDLSLHDVPLSYLQERDYLILVRVRLAQGREDMAGPALKDALYLLTRLLPEAEAKGRMRSVLEILLLQGLALSAQGDRARALTLLERAFALAEPEGYMRLFLDEGTPMLTLLRQAQTHGIAPDYVATLLAAFGEGPEVIQAVLRRPLAESLTAREREVLRLLGSGASNREIAHRLVISMNTVKKHVYNICGKLDVRSRAQAVIKARALHLVG